MRELCQIVAKAHRHYGLQREWQFVAYADDGRELATSAKFTSGIFGPGAGRRERGPYRALLDVLTRDGWMPRELPAAVRSRDWWALSLVRDAPDH